MKLATLHLYFRYLKFISMFTLLHFYLGEIVECRPFIWTFIATLLQEKLRPLPPLIFLTQFHYTVMVFADDISPACKKHVSTAQQPFMASAFGSPNNNLIPRYWCYSHSIIGQWRAPLSSALWWVTGTATACFILMFTTWQGSLFISYWDLLLNSVSCSTGQI